MQRFLRRRPASSDQEKVTFCCDTPCMFDWLRED